jgi:hypothetical protein
MTIGLRSGRRRPTHTHTRLSCGEALESRALLAGLSGAVPLPMPVGGASDTAVVAPLVLQAPPTAGPTANGPAGGIQVMPLVLWDSDGATILSAVEQGDGGWQVVPAAQGGSESRPGGAGLSGILLCGSGGDWLDRNFGGGVYGEADLTGRAIAGLRTLFAFAPIAGEISDGAEAVTGIGPNGEPLSGWERGATVVAAGLPFVPGSVARKALGVASTLVDDALDLVTRADAAADAAKDVAKGSASVSPGSFRPPRSLPRGEYGEMIPDSQYPHTQLGTENSRRVGDYTAAREFGENGKWQRDIHFTDHGRPVNHTNPHQHLPVPNPTGGTPGYGPAVPFDPSNP